jgi:hypothetical protein
LKRVFSVGIIALLLLIVVVSGCTSSGSGSKDPNKDLYIDGAPLIEQTTQDEYGNHVGGNGVLGEWGIMISVRSKSGTAYNNIQANVTSYDENNQVMASKIYTIPYLPKGLGEIIQFSSKNKVDHVTMTIVNATPEE